MCAVDIYIYVCMFVCSGWGWWGWPHSLRRAPFLVHPSLLGSSSCWVNCCPKCFFHGRVWSASFRLHLTGNTLTCRRREGKERKKVSFGNRNDNHVADSPFPSPSHTHTHTLKIESEEMFECSPISWASIMQAFCTALMFMFHWWLNMETLGLY